MKKFFRFPELLLPIAMLVAPAIVGNTSLDIQIHDYYFVFGTFAWGWNVFFVPVNILLTLTWLAHVFGRKYGLLSIRWQWIQVGSTLLCLAVIVKIISSLVFRDGTGFVNYDLPSWEKRARFFYILNRTFLIFLLCQVIFWIGLIAIAVRKAIATQRKRSV
jgi:hypothetical protein